MNNLPEERRTAIRRIVDEIEVVSQRCEAIQKLPAPKDLLELARYYNWDDGMAIPRAIIDHPFCELGVALHLFELAEGIVWLTSGDDWKYQEEWAEFCQDLAHRIQNGHYISVVIPFDSELTNVQRFKAKKNGVPDVFLTSIRP